MGDDHHSGCLWDVSAKIRRPTVSNVTEFPVDLRLLGFHAGVLPDTKIQALISLGAIDAPDGIEESQIQPASLDLRLGTRVYRIRASFLPSDGVPILEKLKFAKLHEFEIGEETVLERGCVYLIPLLEHLRLPRDIDAVANPKSSTGRLDVFARLLCDNTIGFDRIPPGYEGPLFLEVAPRTFSIKVRAGSRLVQLRFRRRSSPLNDESLRRLHEVTPLVRGGSPLIQNGLCLRVNLQPTPDGVIGFRARRHTGLIDIDAVQEYDAEDYWEPIFADRRSELILDVDQFYLLASKDQVVIPPTHAAEMMAFDALMGETRVHYAGFFDPGFGIEPSSVVLEVRSRDVPFVLTDGQKIARLVYEQLTDLPSHLYGGQGSHYQGQGLRLGKQFKLGKWAEEFSILRRKGE